MSAQEPDQLACDWILTQARKALVGVIALSLLSASAQIVWADDPTVAPVKAGSYCPGVKSALWKLVGFHSKKPLDVAEYRQLRQKRMGDFFPESTEVEIAPGKFHRTARVLPEEKAAFESAFDSLLDAEARFSRLPAKDFRTWLVKKTGRPYPPIHSDQIEHAYRENNVTINEVLESYFLDYLADTYKNPTLIREALKKLGPDSLARFSVTALKKFVSFGKGVLYYGPVIAVGNAFFGTGTVPFIEAAHQVGAQLWAKPSQELQKVVNLFTEGFKSQMAKLETSIEELDRHNFSSMSRDDAKKTWAEFQERFFTLFSRSTKTLPSHLRSGRDSMRDWLLIHPMQLASAITTFENMYWQHRLAKEEVLRRVAANGGTPSEEDAQAIKTHSDLMKTAEKRIATGLASWKIYQFAYMEIGRPESENLENVMLANTFERYFQYMDLDQLKTEYTTQLREALRNFDKSMKDLDQTLGGQ